jgi:hypothetical protein
MNGNGDDLAGSADLLREEVTRFSGYLNELDKRLGAGQERVNAGVRSNKRWMRVVLASIALDLVLTAAVGWNYYRIEAVQNRTSNEVLCPLYAIFLDSYHPERQPPERLAEYERSFDVIRKSHDVLGCS